MPFCAHLCLIDEIISRISQNDLHILHNGHICQTCKIIRVNIELAILAFILPTSGHANFECQQYAWQSSWLGCVQISWQADHGEHIGTGNLGFD